MQSPRQCTETRAHCLYLPRHSSALTSLPAAARVWQVRGRVRGCGYLPPPTFSFFNRQCSVLTSPSPGAVIHVQGAEPLTLSPARKLRSKRSKSGNTQTVAEENNECLSRPRASSQSWSQRVSTCAPHLTERRLFTRPTQAIQAKV